MKTLLQKVTLMAAWTMLLATTPALFSQNVNVIDQDIYYQYCVAQPDSVCFEPKEGAVDTVGRDVGALGGSFRFCLTVDTIDSGYAPVRVVLVLDRSRSMCQNPGDSVNGCCTPGDATGNCMMNDPNDMRIQAAHLFVDSLAAKSPMSFVGVVGYDQRAYPHNPVQLNNAQNIENIHDWIDDASCADQGMGPKIPAPGGGLAKTTGTKATGLGMGMDAGLKAVDNRFEEIPAGMTRHIIQLTDGAWDDSTGYVTGPDTLIARYKEQFPGREVPKIHGVFLSNAELHTAHSYPAEGCSNQDPVILTKLQRSTELTGGLYFPGSTPQTVIANFETLLSTIANTAPQQLLSLTVANTTNGETSTNQAITSVGGSAATWQTTVANLPLEWGPNALTITHTISRPGRTDSTITTHVTIVRSEKYREALDTDLYKQYCELVKANIKIKVSPDEKLQNEYFDVSATISGASNFKLDTVQVRLFTRFPDNENGVLATFHLDGDLANASGGAPGVGDPNFTTTDFLYGNAAINIGSFTYSLPQLTDAFVIEEWVKPGTNTTAAVLFSGNGIEIGVNAEMRLYLKSDTSVIVTSVVPLDDGVWSHIGVARSGGKVTLFINGTAVSEATSFLTTVSGGPMTISNPSKWVTDEVRFSNVSRMTNDGATQMLIIPTVPNTLWKVGDAASSGLILKIGPNVWVSGTQLDFQFASPVAGRVILNIRQKEVGDVGTGWSKNSNPINVAADLVPPFVKEGVLTPGPISGTDTRDTLLIKFSEGVNCETLKSQTDPSRTFMVSRGNSDRAELLQGSEYVSKECPDAFINEVVLLVKGGISPETDSIRINSALAVDSAGNASPATNGKKGDIVWGKGTETKVRPIESPDNTMEIDPGAKSKLNIKEEEGKLIAITSRRPFKIVTPGTNGKKDSYGNAMVYDAVGNLIVSDLPIYFTNIPGVYYVLWQGTNRNGRKVGNGSYLIRFFFQYSNGTKGMEKTKVAIKW